MATRGRLVTVLVVVQFISSTLSSSVLEGGNENFGVQKGPVVPNPTKDAILQEAIGDYLSQSHVIAEKIRKLLDIAFPQGVTRARDVTDDDTYPVQSEPRNPMTESEKAFTDTFEKRQFGSILNGGYKLGKRTPGRERGGQGFVLQPHFSYPKMPGVPSPLNSFPRTGAPGMDAVHKTEARGRKFGGTIGGGGYRTAKRERVGTDILGKGMYESKRQFGRVLGGGYKVGKREVTGNHTQDRARSGAGNGNKRQLVSVLGGGYKTGKRETVKTVSPYDDDLYERDRGKAHFGGVLEGEDKIGKIESDGRDDTNRDVFESRRSKRQLGRVLAGGYKAGKRGETAHDELDRTSSNLYSEIPNQGTHSTVPFLGPPSLNQNNAPAENPNSIPAGTVPLAWDQNSIPVANFPEEWNQNSIPVGHIPAFSPPEWSPNRMLTRNLPGDLSLSRTVTVEQHVSLPQSSDQFPFNPSRTQALIQDILQRVEAANSKLTTSTIFSIDPNVVSVFLDGGQASATEPSETANYLDAVQRIYSLLEEAQAILRVLFTSPSSENVPPFYQPDTSTHISSSENGHLHDIRRRSLNDPIRHLHKVQDRTKGKGYEKLSTRNEASPENAALLNWFVPFSKNHKALYRQRRVSMGLDKVHKTRKGQQNPFQDKISNHSKRWFFNIRFPGGYKLGKRTENQNLVAPKFVGEQEFAPSLGKLEGDQLELIDSLTRYVQHLRRTMDDARTKTRSRFIWKNPHGYREKHDAEFKETTKTITNHGIPNFEHFFQFADTVDGNRNTWRLPYWPESNSHIFPIPGIFGLMQQPSISDVKQQKHLKHDYGQKNQHLVDRRRETRDPPLMATFPYGPSWSPGIWNPFGLFYNDKRDQSSKTPMDQSALEESAGNLPENDLHMNKVFFRPVPGGYKTGKYPETMSERNSDAENKRQSYHHSNHDSQAQNMLLQLNNPDSRRDKRIFWRLLGSYRTRKGWTHPEKINRVQRSVHPKNGPGQSRVEPTHNSISGVGAVPARDMGKRFLWKVLGGYKLGKRGGSPGTQASKSSQTTTGGADLPEFVKLVPLFRDLSKHPDDAPTGEEIGWFMNVLKSYMFLDSPNSHGDNSQANNESFTVYNMKRKRPVWNFVGGFSILRNEAKSKSKTRPKPVCSLYKRDSSNTAQESGRANLRRKRSAPSPGDQTTSAAKRVGFNGVKRQKRFWGKIIAGYKIAGKREAGRGAEYRNESTDRHAGLEKHLWSKELAGGYNTIGKHNSPTATSGLDEGEGVGESTFQRGAQIKHLWQKLRHDFSQQRLLPGPPLAQPDTGADPPSTVPHPHPPHTRTSHRQPVLWKLLADFFFGDHLDNSPGILLDFLDPASFSSPSDTTKSTGVISYGSRPGSGDVISPSEGEGQEELIASDVTSQSRFVM